MLEEFKRYMLDNEKSDNTIENYTRNVKQYIKWLEDSTGQEFKKLYRANILDYKSFLRNIKKNKKGNPLKAETINANLSALILFNKFLQKANIQNDIVVTDEELIKIQKQKINPTKVGIEEVEEFRQIILENEGVRNYAIVTIMAYCLTRISETLNIELADFDFHTRELIIRNGKGAKQRITYMNDKVINSIKEWIKIRPTDRGNKLFCSRQRETISRSRINQIFNKYSNIITPHQLRHFGCTNLYHNGQGFSLIEIASMAGHSSTSTTEIYVSPTEKERIRKINEF